MKAPADPARKVTLCRPSRVLTPRSGPAVSPFPAAPPGVRPVLLGPWPPGRRLPLPPPPLFSSFSKAGSAPPAGNPAPPPSLPPDRERRDRPGRAAGLSIKGCGPAPIRAGPRPGPREAPPHLPGLERPRMRPGEAMGAGRGRGLESEPRSRLESGHDPGLWSSEGRERHRVCDGVRERTRCDGPGIETQESHLGSPPLSSFSPLVLPGTPAATSARDPKSQADGPWSERWCHLAGRVGTARGGGGGDPRLREALTTGWGGASAPLWVGQRLPPPPQVLEARLPSPQAGTQQKDLKELRAPIVCTWRPVVALSVRSRIGEPSILLSLTPPSSRSSLGGAD